MFNQGGSTRLPKFTAATIPKTSTNPRAQQAHDFPERPVTDPPHSSLKNKTESADPTRNVLSRESYPHNPHHPNQRDVSNDGWPSFDRTKLQSQQPGK